MTRSQSREQAFALLFEKSFNPETDMDDIISLSLENELIEPDEFASMLAQTAWDKLFQSMISSKIFKELEEAQNIPRRSVRYATEHLRAYVHTGSPGRHFNKRGCRAV